MGQSSSHDNAANTARAQTAVPRSASSQSRSLLSRLPRSLSHTSSSTLDDTTESCSCSEAGPSTPRASDAGTRGSRFSPLKRIRQTRSKSCPAISSIDSSTPIGAMTSETLARNEVSDKPDDNGASGRPRPPLRQSLSVSRLSATNETLEPPLEILPLQEEPEEMGEETETSTPLNDASPSPVLRGPEPSAAPTDPSPAPARRIVVTGTVSTLPRASPALAALRSAAHSAAASVASSSSFASSSASSTGSSEGADTAQTTPAPSTSNLPSEPFASTGAPSSDGNAEQAILISRLLSVAAAATAASLLPGRIHINGQLIEGFPSSAGAQGAAPIGIPMPHPTRTASGPARTNNWRERLRNRPRSFTTAPTPSLQPSTVESDTTPALPAQSPLSPLQSILRQALAAEFGAHAPEVRRADELDRPTSPLHESTSEPATGQADNITAASATTFLLSSPSPDRPEGPMSAAPEGSFERFLYTLQSEVSVAILRALREQAEVETEPVDDEFLLLSRSATAVTSRESRRLSQQASLAAGQPAFSFFRSFRWPDHHLSAAGMLSEGPASSTEGASSTPSDVALTESSTNSEGSDAENSSLTVAPVLMVGVRTVDIAMSSPSSPAMPSPFASQTSPSTTSASDSLPPAQSSSQGEHQRSWMIWIAGGIYPPNHPLLSFPALLSGFDNAASYEELLRLADMMGGHKPPIATQAEIDASGLKVVRGHELAGLTTSGEVLANTSERCLICLEDWVEQDEARILGCKHAFHRACIDQWLCSTHNNCPCCRSRAATPGSAAQATAATAE